MTSLSFPASQIPAVVMPMLWRDRIPAATLTVIAGRPGLGKSTLGTAIAAELSQRHLHTLVSNMEDDLAAVVRPRLEVAGAELDRVHLVPPESSLVIPRDLEQLREVIFETHASCVILDPLAAHFDPEKRVHDRPTLRLLIQMARETRCAIVGIHHTTKSPVGPAINSIGGPAGGLAGSARAVYLYGYDPEDEDRRALACVKVNGVDTPSSLVIEHETVEYNAGNALVEAGLLRIVEESNASAKKVLHPGRRHKDRDAECAEWLTVFMAAGENCQRQVQEIRREGKAAGFGWQTLQRACVALKGEKVKVGFGGDGFWLWRLPDEHPLRTEELAA